MNRRHVRYGSTTVVIIYRVLRRLSVGLCCKTLPMTDVKQLMNRNHNFNESLLRLRAASRIILSFGWPKNSFATQSVAQRS